MSSGSDYYHYLSRLCKNGETSISVLTAAQIVPCTEACVALSSVTVATCARRRNGVTLSYLHLQSFCARNTVMVASSLREQDVTLSYGPDELATDLQSF